MRTLDRRKQAPPRTVTPLMPQQIRDAIAIGKVAEVAFTRKFLIGTIIAQLMFAMGFANWGYEQFWPLIVVALLTVPLSLAALVWLQRGHVVAAGIMAVVVPLFPTVAYTVAFSVESSFHIILFTLGVALFVLLPNDQSRVRLSLALAFFVTFALCEALLVPSRSWVEMEPEALTQFASINRTLTAVFIILFGIILHRRTEYHRRILEGAARYGELLATTDHLTGLPNRRPIIAQLEEFEREEISDYAIVLIDIDHFKSVNDEFGHHCGDAMIRHVGHHLREHFRESDMASRWGGDEFLVLMPSIPRRSLVSVLERLRSSIASMAVPCADHVHHVTVSIGAAHGITGETSDECIAAADHALYRAKHEGRDRVVAVGTSDR